MFHTTGVDKRKTHILFSISFFRKSCHLRGNVEKYGISWVHRRKYKTAHALCMLGMYGYRNTLRMCNTYCFPTKTTVTRTRLNVTLYVPCLSCCTYSAPCFNRKHSHAITMFITARHYNHNRCLFSTYEHQLSAAEEVQWQRLITHIFAFSWVDVRFVLAGISRY